MKKQKTLIQIICLCNDIDNLERTLFQLSNNALFLDKTKNHVILEVNMLASSYIIDWKNSVLKQDFFLKKFNHLKNYVDWADESYFNFDNVSYGGCDITNIKIDSKYEFDNILLVDVDLIFSNYTLSSFLDSPNILPKSKYIITPSLVKLWDNTWDTLVNPNFLNKPLNYNKTNNSIVDVNQDYGDITLTPLQQFKWAGGWFTLLSRELIEFLKIPNDIKGFCPIDTAIMYGCSLFPDITQYKIDNLIVCEDIKITPRNLYNEYISFTGKNKDYYNSGYQKLIQHFNNLSLE